MVDLARWRCGHFPGLGHVGLQGHVNHRYQHDQAHSLPRVQHRYALVVIVHHLPMWFPSVQPTLPTTQSLEHR
jgi:hypothetical protein